MLEITLRRYGIGIAAALVLPLTLKAQAASRAREVPAAISSIRVSDLERDLHAMASDAMRGREGATIDELRASIWLAEEYRKIGLEPRGDLGTYFQWFPVVRTRVSTTASRVSLDGRPLSIPGDIIPVAVTPAAGTGSVLWIPDATDTTADIRGRIVATRLAAPLPNAIRANSYPFAVRYVDAAVSGTVARFARRGARAVLLVADARADSAFDAWATMRIRGLYEVDSAAPRFAGQPTRVPPVPALGSGTPAFLVRAAMAETLVRGAEAMLDVRLERFEVPSVNVIGAVRGTDPRMRSEYVLFSSHQDANGVRFPVDGDSIWAGADDNASVSVAMLAAARAFARQPARRSVLFVNHGAEERGLLGSRYHAAHPVVPLSQIVAVLNGDMIGRNHPDSASVLGVQPPHRNSRPLAACKRAHRQVRPRHHVGPPIAPGRLVLSQRPCAICATARARADVHHAAARRLPHAARLSRPDRLRKAGAHDEVDVPHRLVRGECREPPGN
jgi:hypothetical protein